MKNKRKILFIGVVALLLTSATAREKTEIDEENKYDKLRKACVKKNNKKACYELGKYHANGEDGTTRPDFYGAVRFYKIACKKGSGEGCYEMSKCYKKGKALPKSEPSEIKYAKLACNNGIKEACDFLTLKTLDKKQRGNK